MNKFAAFMNMHSLNNETRHERNQPNKINLIVVSFTEREVLMTVHEYKDRTLQLFMSVWHMHN